MELSSARNGVLWGDLLCEEDADELDEISIGFPASGASFEFPDDSDESIAAFVEGEAEYSPAEDYPARLRSRSIDSAAREVSVGWILQVRVFIVAPAMAVSAQRVFRSPSVFLFLF